MSTCRKRVISSCIPCYTRKQKCNRGYPCNHCTRRQRKEDCFYYPTNGGQPVTSPGAASESRRETSRPISSRNEWVTNTTKPATMPPAPSSAPWTGPSLAETFGYFQNSDSNTLALIQKAGLAHRDSSSGMFSPTLNPEAIEEVQRNLERMPDRQILDFLVKYFAAEVNWMDQLVQIPWFLAKYQAWWMVKRITLVAGVDFAVLILRICSYTLQFLPSPGYTLDTIRGVPLVDIRNMCDETADNLEAISTATDSRGSLIRVQHVAFLALQCKVEAKSHTSWEVLGRAIRIAQDIGLHRNNKPEARKNGEVDNKIEEEMERMTFCNLFIHDSLLSRQLDRIPSHPGLVRRDNWPRLTQFSQKGTGVDDGTPPNVGPDSDEAPNSFTERVLQANLADFWRRVGPVHRTGDNDILAAEERYDKLCSEYLAQLPPAFALKNFDDRWDKEFPKLSLQRKLLHIAIYDSLCWIFRPLLLRQSTPLPPYKSVILASQRRKLAAAALLTLESVTQLHTLLGGCHTRAAAIVFSTFEAAVILAFVYADPMFDEDCPPRHLPPPGTLTTDPLQATVCHTTRDGCLQAIKAALERLEMLAEVSTMADVAANTLTRLLNKVTENPGKAGGPEMMTGVSVEEMLSSTATAQIPKSIPSAVDAGVAPEGVTTSSQPGMKFAAVADDAAPWLSAGLPDLRSRDEIMASSADTAAVGDISSWAALDGANMYVQPHTWVPPVDFW